MNCTMLIINCALCLYWVSHLHVVAISVNRKYKDEVKDVTVSVTDDKVKIGARNGNSNGNGIGTGSANGHGHGDDNASGSATVTDTDIAADKTKGSHCLQPVCNIKYKIYYRIISDSHHVHAMAWAMALPWHGIWHCD